MKDVNKTALYRYFNSDDALLYVGISSRLTDRVKRHSIGSDFFSQSVRMTIEWFDTRDEAIDAEIIAIKSEEPIFNVTHNTRKTSDPEEEPKIQVKSIPKYDITHNELKYVIAAYRTTRLSDAAKIYGVSQPTVSCALRGLQERIGVSIFSKNDNFLKKGKCGEKRTMNVTEKGARFLDECLKLESAFLEFDKNVKIIKRSGNRRYLKL